MARSGGRQRVVNAAGAAWGRAAGAPDGGGGHGCKVDALEDGVEVIIPWDEDGAREGKVEGEHEGQVEQLTEKALARARRGGDGLVLVDRLDERLPQPNVCAAKDPVVVEQVVRVALGHFESEEHRRAVGHLVREAAVRALGHRAHGLAAGLLARMNPTESAEVGLELCDPAERARRGA